MANNVIEVIPGRLHWAPETRDYDISSVGESLTPLPCTALVGSLDLYTVAHYPKEALGRAFGPVPLDKQLDFCVNLKEKMGAASCDDGSGRILALTTPPNDIQTRANMATMLGTYLVLRHGWSAKKVQEVLGSEEGDRLFACSWSRSYKKEGKRNHRVYDCWAGIELAKHLEWIHPTVASDMDAKDKFCVAYRKWAVVYDAAWIVPGRIIVCAEPATTALDSNPATFKDIFPKKQKSLRGTSPRSLRSDTSSRGSSKSAASSQKPNERVLWPSWSPAASTVCDTDSTDTVCKTDYASSNNSSEAIALFDDGPTMDFVSILKRAGVRCMIRCNYDDEPGMPIEGSYDAFDMEENGIAHSDINVPDHDGGLPTRKGFRSAAELITPVLDSDKQPNAVAVHCKGGFGRSVVLACCLAIDHYDIPGDALMGWVRMSRPGAVTTPTQEQFLKKMTGRAALRRWAGLPGVPVAEDDDDDVSATKGQPTCGCSLM